MEANRKVLVFDPLKCTGCQLCEQFCSMGHIGVINPSKSRIRIFRDHKLQLDLAIYCHQCFDPPCVNSCDFDALSPNQETHAIETYEENCIGCRKCIEECPYAAPIIDPEKGTIIICDLCGGSPDCVEVCPEKAIQYLNIEKVNDFYKSRYRKKMAKTLIQGEKGNE
jgi:Fe-S-cluster-containing dehydrogenase component